VQRAAPLPRLRAAAFAGSGGAQRSDVASSCVNACCVFMCSSCGCLFPRCRELLLEGF